MLNSRDRRIAGLVRPMIVLCCVVAAALGAGATATAAPSSATGTGTASGGAFAASGVRLPRDEAPHAAPTEWWYFSGHLAGRDRSGRVHRYGFEYVTFQFLEPGSPPVYFGNLAVTDLNRRTFHYAAAQDSYPVPVTPGSFDLHTGTWTMRGSDGHDALHAGLTGYSLRLRLDSTKPAAIHGRHGTIPMGPFGSSQYYSWTSLRTSGVVVDHGTRVWVHGVSWMDHQWGAIDFASGGGWDWFSVQLTNGQQYMLYFIRDASGAIVDTLGTRIDRHGRAVPIPRARLHVRATGHWRSPVTGINYSSGWRIRLPGGHLTITPKLLDQELDLRQVMGVVYWEGDVSIRGRLHGDAVRGVGYTEINPPLAAS